MSFNFLFSSIVIFEEENEKRNENKMEMDYASPLSPSFEKGRGEKENELSRNSLVFSSLLFSKKPGRGGGKGHFSFDACGCEGHRRALGYCAKNVIYSNYLNKTAYFRTKIIKYCLKNSTKS